MLEIQQLERLVALAECETLTRVSERLHVSQPALTQSMKSIEAAIGVPLFERSGNRIALNDAGALLAEEAAGILSSIGDLEDRVRRKAAQADTLSIGACAPAPLWQLETLAEEALPHAIIVSELVHSDEELLRGLSELRYRIVVLHEPPMGDGIAWAPFMEERLSLSVPCGHSLASAASLRFADLDGHNILLYHDIGFWYERCKKLLPNAAFLEMDDWSAFEEVAGTAAFPSFCTDALDEPRRHDGSYKVIPLEGPEAYARYHIAMRKDDDEARSLLA